MTRVLIDSETYSYWNGYARIQLGEARWKIYLAEQQEKERYGEIKLVEFPQLRSHEIERERQAVTL